MRKLLKIIARLYPKPWRDRYGEEFAALLDDMHPKWQDVWNVAAEAFFFRSMAMKAWQWIALGAAFGFVAHGVALYLYNPPGYSSQATIRLWGGDLPTKHEHVRRVAQAALSRETMEHFVRLYRLNPGGLPMHDAVDMLERQIRVEQLAEQKFGGGILQLRIRANDPATAQQLSSDVMARLIEASRTLPQADHFAVRMLPWSMPTKPLRPIRWLAAERVLGLGAVFGAMAGAAVAAGSLGWRTRRAK